MAGKVFIVSSKWDADYKVFFVDSKFQEKNADIIKGCKLATSKGFDTVKVFIVQSKWDADILITRQNFPKR